MKDNRNETNSQAIEKIKRIRKKFVKKKGGGTAKQQDNQLLEKMKADDTLVLKIQKVESQDEWTRDNFKQAIQVLDRIAKVREMLEWDESELEVENFFEATKFDADKVRRMSTIWLSAEEKANVQCLWNQREEVFEDEKVTKTDLTMVFIKIKINSFIKSIKGKDIKEALLDVLRQKKHKVEEKNGNDITDSQLAISNVSEEKYIEPVKFAEQLAKELGQDELEFDTDEVKQKKKDSELVKKQIEEFKMKRKQKISTVKSLLENIDVNKQNSVDLLRNMWENKNEDDLRKMKMMQAPDLLQQIDSIWKNLDTMDPTILLKDAINEMKAFPKVAMILAIALKTIQSMRTVLFNVVDNEVKKDQIDLQVAKNKKLKDKKGILQLQVNAKKERKSQKGFIEEDKWKNMTVPQRVLAKYVFKDFKQNPSRISEFTKEQQDEFLGKKRLWRETRVQQIVQGIKDKNERMIWLRRGEAFIYYQNKTPNGYFVDRKFKKEVWDKYLDSDKVKEAEEFIRNELKKAQDEGVMFGMLFKNGKKRYGNGRSLLLSGFKQKKFIGRKKFRDKPKGKKGQGKANKRESNAKAEGMELDQMGENF